MCTLDTPLFKFQYLVTELLKFNLQLGRRGRGKHKNREDTDDWLKNINNTMEENTLEGEERSFSGC